MRSYEIGAFQSNKRLLLSAIVMPDAKQRIYVLRVISNFPPAKLNSTLLSQKSSQRRQLPEPILHGFHSMLPMKFLALISRQSSKTNARTHMKRTIWIEQFQTAHFSAKNLHLQRSEGRRPFCFKSIPVFSILLQTEVNAIGMQLEIWMTEYIYRLKNAILCARTFELQVPEIVSSAT